MYLRNFGKDQGLLLAGQTGVEGDKLKLVGLLAKDRVSQQLVVQGGDLLHSRQKDQDGASGVGSALHNVHQDSLDQVVVDLVEVHFGQGLGGGGGAPALVTGQHLFGADVFVFLTCLGFFHLS